MGAGSAAADMIPRDPLPDRSGPGLHKATGFFEKSRTKKSQRLAFFEIFNRKKPAAGFFLLFSGFFFNLMKFGQIPTNFQENFDEMRSDLIKIPRIS